MTRTDVRNGSREEVVEHGRPTAGGRSASNFSGVLRKLRTPGNLAGLGGGLMVLRGLRAVRRGKRLRGLGRIVVGGLLLAAVQRGRRRSTDTESAGAGGPGQEDVVDTSPDIDHVDDAGLDQEEHASGEAARDVAASSVDVEDAAEDQNRAGAADVEIDFASDVDEPTEGIGSGTFDARRGVPVPETAFDEGFLELDEEAFWGIRDSDDAVFVSRHQSVFKDSEGVEYVTSSEVDEEQLLSVPEVILDHWEGVDDVAPVEDADELVFATTDDLRWVDVLWIVSEHRTGEFEDL